MVPYEFLDLGKVFRGEVAFADGFEAWTIRQVYRPLTAKFLGTARRKVMVRPPSGIFRADPEMRKMAFMGTCVERPERIWPTYSSSNSGKLLLKKRVPSGAS